MRSGGSGVFHALGLRLHDLKKWDLSAAALKHALNLLQQEQLRDESQEQSQDGEEEEGGEGGGRLLAGAGAGAEARAAAARRQAKWRSVAGLALYLAKQVADWELADELGPRLLDQLLQETPKTESTAAGAVHPWASMCLAMPPALRLAIARGFSLALRAQVPPPPPPRAALVSPSCLKATRRRRGRRH